MKKTRILLLVIGLLLVSAQAYAHTDTQIDPTRFPSSSNGIMVFNDQINVHYLTDAQAEFAATHYAGTQKLTLEGAQRLRAYNPYFVVLHYRLGLGLGHSTPNADCQPSSEFIHIISGDWVQEWPGDEALPEDWFYHYDGQRVFQCDWGWYLMDTDNPDYRAWWMEQVLDQLALNENDGLFADSVNVPNGLGADRWRPVLPELDEAWEADWSRRIEDWITWTREQFGGQYTLIVNAGGWITTRDQTDYSLADGVMIEAFAGWGEYSRFEVFDWALQMDRILSLVNQDRIVILQNYVGEPSERLWMLANYLLVKGNYTYINLEVSDGAEWFPEYDLPIGEALTPVPTTIEDLRLGNGLYSRSYRNARVFVNPDPNGAPITMLLEEPQYLVTEVIGGGDIPEDADMSAWSVVTSEIDEVTVEPGQAVILLGG